MNSHMKANIMMPAWNLNKDTRLSPSGHPYAYACVLGIFHAKVIYKQDGISRPTTHTKEFLWVHRYRIDNSYKGGFATQRLYQVEPLAETDLDTLDFVNPDDVIQGVHLIPAFQHGQLAPQSELLMKSAL